MHRLISARWLVTFAVLGIFLAYFFLNISQFRPLLHVNVLFLIGIALSNVAGVAMSGIFTKFILRPFNKEIPIIESFYVSLISSVGNFFAPIGAGFGFRAVYLKKKFNLSYSDYITTLSGNYIIVFLVNSLLALISLYVLRRRSDAQYGLLVAIFAGIFATSLLLSVIKLPLLPENKISNKYLGRIYKILHRIMSGWNHIASHKKLMVQLICITFASLFLNLAIMWMIIHSIHLSVALAPLVLFSVLGSLSLFINITPANLGVKEAIYLFSSSILGFSVSQILSIALIDRGVMFLVLAALWAISHNLKKPIKY